MKNRLLASPRSPLLVASPSIATASLSFGPVFLSPNSDHARAAVFIELDPDESQHIPNLQPCPKEDPIEKRRAQLRRAQQSYRDRKNKYTKSLEREIAHTRVNETKLMRESERLRAAVQMLMGLLSQHGIHAPAHLWDDDAQEETDPTFASTPGTFTSPGPTTWQLQPQMPTTSTAGASPEPSSSQGKNLNATVTQQWTSPGSSNDHWPSSEDQEDFVIQPSSHDYQVSYAQTSLQSSNPPATSTTASARLHDLDLATVGMEFVLTLERPCLGHLSGDTNEPHEPTGHALTVSAQLLLISAPPPDSQKPHKPRVPSYQKAPAALLDRLLSLSPDLCPEGEVTPVQAWNYIRSQPHFGGLEAQTVQMLADRLRKAVKCHGFGAVVDSAVFRSLVNETLMLGWAF